MSILQSEASSMHVRSRRYAFSLSSQPQIARNRRWDCINGSGGKSGDSMSGNEAYPHCLSFEKSTLGSFITSSKDISFIAYADASCVGCIAKEHTQSPLAMQLHV